MDPERGLIKPPFVGWIILSSFLFFLKKIVLAPWLLGNPGHVTRMGTSLLQIATKPFRLPEASLKVGLLCPAGDCSEEEAGDGSGLGTSSGWNPEVVTLSIYTL